MGAQPSAFGGRQTGVERGRSRRGVHRADSLATGAAAASCDAAATAPSEECACAPFPRPFFAGGEEEGEGAPAGGELGEFYLVLGGVELGVEVVDPELVEVAEDDVRWAAGDEARPVVEGLAVMLGEVGDSPFSAPMGKHDGKKIAVLALALSPAGF